MKNRVVTPCRVKDKVLNELGEEVRIPEGWAFLPAGDGPLTKLVKAKGATWLVQVTRKRRKISQGVWAHEDHIRRAREEIEAKRSAPDYLKNREKALERREKKHREYHTTFIASIESFLNFHQRYEDLAHQLARIVAEHATPVGSGTVARTEQIPLSKRASYAVIAWMRHETTGYDKMKIPRVKGKRRQVRSELAAQSVNVLEEYRKGIDTPDSCPLKAALSRH